MKKTISIQELHSDLSKISRNIHKDLDRYVITKNGKPKMIMISIDDKILVLERKQLLKSYLAKVNKSNLHNEYV